MVELLKEIDHKDLLNDVTHIYFSHEHPDHFSIPFLNQFLQKKGKKLK